LYSVSKLVETFTGYRIPANKPIVDNVFTQTAGIHADGDNKNNLYFNDLLPNVLAEGENTHWEKHQVRPILKNLQELGLQLNRRS
jgi:D-citramalate synthase